MTMIKVDTIVSYLDRFAPRDLAAEWDNVGLLLGDRHAAVQRVLTCLTVTPEVVAEAVEAGAQLIVTHHPILFRPVKRLTTGNTEGQMLLALVRAGCAVYSPHTSFDNTVGGINERLAKHLDLTDVAPLRPRDADRQCKVVVFVPEKDLPAVSEAMFKAGAGRIGDYRECSFRSAGTGTFFGSDDTNPSVGQKGRREEVSELRLEVVCPEAAVNRVVEAMRRTHSYEEPAFDVYPLRQGVASVGEGRIGQLPKPTPLKKLAQAVKKKLAAGAVQVVGDPAREVRRVAVVCGAGGEFLGDAVRARADVLLTGEMRFHDYLAARAQDIALVLPGHFATERPAVEELAGQLRQQFPDLQVWASRQERDPVTWL